MNNGQGATGGKVSLAVILLTLNESIHLRRALEHIRGIAEQVFVIDSFSTDNTVELARAYGATVLQHQFQNYARQFAWALDNAPITTDWVMRLDADEIVEPDLASEIATRLPELPPEVTGIVLNRKTIFQGRFIRHGGRYPLMLLRIWRRGKARIEDRWMDEHTYLIQGRSVVFRGGFSDYNLRDLTAFTEKHNHYASREALDVFSRSCPFLERPEDLTVATTARQAKQKRFLKESLYNRLPYELSTLGYFLYRYFFQLGFLDGREGFTYHILQCFWYRFLVGAKVRELESAVRGVRDREEARRIIARTTRQKLGGSSSDGDVEGIGQGSEVSLSLLDSNSR